MQIFKGNPGIERHLSAEGTQPGRIGECILQTLGYIYLYNRGKRERESFACDDKITIVDRVRGGGLEKGLHDNWARVEIITSENALQRPPPSKGFVFHNKLFLAFITLYSRDVVLY